MTPSRRDVQVRIGRIVIDATAVERGELNARDFTASLQTAIADRLASATARTTPQAQTSVAAEGLVGTIAGAVEARVGPLVAGTGSHAR
jgi:hypothetical protein